MEIIQAHLHYSATMEAKFIALEKTSFEAEWLINLLADITLWIRPTPSTSMSCDSQPTIAKAKSKIFNWKNKLIQGTILCGKCLGQGLYPWIL